MNSNVFNTYEYAIDGVTNRNIMDSEALTNALVGRNECYRSIYKYPETIIDLKHSIESHGTVFSTSYYNEENCPDNLIIDIDSDGESIVDRVSTSLTKVQCIIFYLFTNYGVEPIQLRYNFSGSKGFHICIASEAFGERIPSVNSHEIDKKIIEAILPIEFGYDTSIYKRNSLIRIINTRNINSGLFAIPLSYEDIMFCGAEDIIELATRVRNDYEIQSENVIAIPINQRISEIASKIQREAALKSANILTSSGARVIKDSIVSVRQIVDRCKIINSICNKQVDRKQIGHVERMFLGTNLMQCGDAGTSYVHEVLSSQENYNSEITQFHLQEFLGHEYNPCNCSTFCSKPCKPASLLYANSPYELCTEWLAKFNQSFTLKAIGFRLKRYIRYHTGSKTFYLYDKGVFTPTTEMELAIFLNSLLPFFIPEEDVSSTRINGIIERMKMSAEFQITHLDGQDKYLINLNNGLYNVRENKLIPHSPDYFTTARINVEYDPDGTCPLFLEKLNEIFCGNSETIDFLLQYFGYCFIKDNSVHKFLVLHGRSGRNGKGVLTRMLSKMIGQGNCSYEDFHSIASDKNYSSISLKDKLVNFSSELNTNEADIAVIKRLVGGDKISTRPIYQEKVQFDNYARFIVSTNSIPRVTNLDKAYMDRIEIIDFPKTFSGAEDTRLEEKLMPEYNGIFNLIMDSFRKCISEDGAIRLNIPKSITENKYAFISEMHSVTEFFEEKTAKSSDENLPDHFLFSSIFAMYDSWCKESNYRPVGKSLFKQIIQNVLGAHVQQITYIKSINGTAHKNQNWIIGLKLDKDALHCVDADFERFAADTKSVGSDNQMMQDAGQNDAKFIQSIMDFPTEKPAEIKRAGWVHL